MARPIIPPLDWATATGSLVVAPSASLTSSGWSPNDKLPAQVANYIFNLHGQWQQYLSGSELAVSSAFWPLSATVAAMSGTTSATTGVFSVLTGTVTTGSTALFQTITGTSTTGTTALFTAVSGVSVTGTTARFTFVTGTSVTGTVGLFVTGVFQVLTGTSVSGTTAQFTTITGTVVTGTTGVYSVVTGTTVTGTTALFTTITGTTITGTTVTGTTALFTTITGTTVTGTTSRFQSATFNSLTSTLAYQSGVVSGLVASPMRTVAALYSKATQQFIANATLVTMSFDTREFDTDNAFASGSASQFTVPAGAGGLYQVCAAFRCLPTGTSGNGPMHYVLVKNGVSYKTGTSIPALGGLGNYAADPSLSAYVSATAGDTLSLTVFQQSGFGQLVGNAVGDTYVQIVRMPGS